MNTRGAFLGRIFVSCCAFSLAAAPLYAHRFTPVSGRTPVTAFACQDTVTVHIAFDPAPAGHEPLVAEWHNTSTDLRHSTRIDVNPRQSEAWVWMKYDPPAGSRLDPASDGGYDPFAGHWTVNLFLDRRPIGATEFIVRC